MTTPRKTVSPLFRAIESLQGERPWGSFLDAGTGRNSLQWICGLETERWTAVTASPSMAKVAREAAGKALRDQDRVIVDNWMSDELLYGECFDTVLLDYFIGAIEGFAPYWQERVLQRVRPHVKHRLYIVGTEPYVLDDPSTEAGLPCGADYVIAAEPLDKQHHALAVHDGTENASA